MATLSQEIEAYEGMQRELEAKHFGEWVVVRDGQLACAYEDFQDAAAEAVRRFGRGPYLIRQVGRSTLISLPASVQYRPVA